MVAKFWYVCAILVTCACANLALTNEICENDTCIKNLLDGKTQRAFENVITNMVECLRQKIKEGIPELGMSFDPFKFPILPLLLNNQYVSSSMLLTKLLIEGLAGFQLKRGTVEINILQLEATVAVSIIFDEIKMSTDYNGNMQLFEIIRIFGKGSVSMEFDNLRVDLDLVIKFFPTRITEPNLVIQLPSTKAKITGLFNDEYMSMLISKQTTDTFTLLAIEQQENFNRLVDDFFQQVIDSNLNPYLSHLTIEDIIELIINGGFNCEPAFLKIVNFFNETVANTLFTEKYDSIANYDFVN